MLKVKNYNIKLSSPLMFPISCRLSYHQRITEMMPEAYAKLVPVQPQPNYKYASEEAGKK